MKVEDSKLEMLDGIQSRVIFVLDADDVVGEAGLKQKSATPKMLRDQEVCKGKTIEVRGLHSSTTFDAVLLFFESLHWSGGDTVDSLQLNTDRNVAYVTFKNPQGRCPVCTNKPCNVCCKKYTILLRIIRTRIKYAIEQFGSSTQTS